MSDQFKPGGYVPGSANGEPIPFIYRHDRPDGRREHLISAEGTRTGKCSVCDEQVFDPAKVRAAIDKAQRGRDGLQRTAGQHERLALHQAEKGRELANRRDDLIAEGVDPADLEIPIHLDDQEQP